MRNWLKKLRVEHHLTQQDLATKMNINVRTYNRLELGKLQQDLNLSTAKKLCQIFKITLDQIQFNEECESYSDSQIQNKISSIIANLGEK